MLRRNPDNLPQTVFSQALVDTHSVSMLLTVVPWIWFNLLQFTVANQSTGKSPEEDALNKPNRPLPAKRISLSSARLLRWLLVPACILLSSIVGGLYGAIGIAVLNALYNEASWAGHWVTKNACNAGFYASFEYGATLVASKVLFFLICIIAHWHCL